MFFSSYIPVITIIFSLISTEYVNFLPNTILKNLYLSKSHQKYCKIANNMIITWHLNAIEMLDDKKFCIYEDRTIKHICK